MYDPDGRSLESLADEVAIRIMQGGHFVTPDVRKVWIRTCLLEWYSKGRVSVFVEEHQDVMKKGRELFDRTRREEEEKEEEKD